MNHTDEKKSKTSYKLKNIDYYKKSSQLWTLMTDVFSIIDLGQYLSNTCMIGA